MKFIVYEYTEKASPLYVGHRFSCRYDGNAINENVGGRLKVVGKDLSAVEASALCNTAGHKSILSYALSNSNNLSECM
jgi:hypothetical protein